MTTLSICLQSLSKKKQQSEALVMMGKYSLNSNLIE